MKNGKYLQAGIRRNASNGSQEHYADSKQWKNIQKLSSMKGVRKISNFLVVPEIYFSPGDYYRTVFP